jgi:hypothetical protein
MSRHSTILKYPHPLLKRSVFALKDLPEKKFVMRVQIKTPFFAVRYAKFPGILGSPDCWPAQRTGAASNHAPARVRDHPPPPRVGPPTR